MESHDGAVATAAERFAIQEVIFRYSDAVTRSDYVQMRTLFAPDAVWESPLLGFHFDDATSFIEYQIAGSATLDVLIQTASNPVVELSGDVQASATTTIREMIRGTNLEEGVFGAAGSEINVDQFGIYYDELKKVDGRWVFTHRRFVPFLIATGTVAGDVVSARPLVRPGG
jgi:hypothetical protein